MKIFVSVIILILSFSLAYAQDPSTIFFNGGLPDSMAIWAWNFSDESSVETPVPNTGYSPGTSAIGWDGYNQGGWQGFYIHTWDGEDYAGVDMTSIWDTDSVYFKMKAPNGLNPSDPPLSVLLYDPRDVYDCTEN